MAAYFWVNLVSESTDLQFIGFWDNLVSGKKIPNDVTAKSSETDATLESQQYP